MAFENFDPIFDEVRVEWVSQSCCPVWPFFVHAYSPDSSQLVIQVTNSVSEAWENRLSRSMLEDIRDMVGIGGSWSEFADYLIASLKSPVRKLVLEANSNSGGVSNAKLVAQKSKGMPLITIPLTKLVDSAAMEVQSKFFSSIIKAFKSMECSLVKEQEHSSRLTNMLEERNGTVKPEQRQKFQKISNSEKGVSIDGLQNSPDKQAARDNGSTKVKNRKVPAHRRTKVRGAVLHDNDE